MYLQLAKKIDDLSFLTLAVTVLIHKKNLLFLYFCAPFLKSKIRRFFLFCAHDGKQKIQFNTERVKPPETVH